jgi:DNA-binding response OmpR family regulator
MNVLIVEDNKHLSDNIQEYLELEGFSTTQAFDGESGEDEIYSNLYDCVLLDINLPQKGGLEVCTQIREDGITVPIIILTARTGEDETVAGLSVGADDYLTKPFGMKELIARINSVVRRSKNHSPDKLTIENLMIDRAAQKVLYKETEVKLAPKEYALLSFLAENRGVVQSRETIIEKVWGEYDTLAFSQTVDVHIAYLRKKLDKKIIKTAHGGYYIP